MADKEINIYLKKTKKNIIKGRTKNYWITIRRKAGEGYFDVLIGKKGEDSHIHYGLYGNYTYKFLEDRGKVKRVTRERIKKNKEKELIDERVFSKKGEPQLIVKFRFNSRMKEGEIYTYIVGITLSERKIISVKKVKKK